MFNIFNNAKTLYGAYNNAQKKKDLYSGPISSVYKPPQGAPRSQMIGNQSVSVTGSPKAPQSFYAPVTQKKTITPSPDVAKTSQVSQPTASEVLQQKYSNYLMQSQANKEKLAEQNRADAEAKAMESYNANKAVADTSRSNLEEMMKGFRERSASGQARLDTQAQQNRERALRTSGESQRQLMETRRDQLGDVERRYSALGTVDSYGTGSFQSANQNVENDFLRLTASNKQKLQDDLLDIDNKLFDAKAQAEEKIAVEEAKYKDALSQIQQLLVGNEVEKNQAIRAAQSLLQQKKTEIYDEYEGYRIQAEQDKVKKQEEIDAANAGDAKLQGVLKGASQEFLTTGVPKTAQDQFIVFKYPKEVEAYMKMLTDSKVLGGTNNEKGKLISLVDDISKSSGLGRITGIQGIVPLLPGSNEMITKGQIDQLKALLSLENRQKLKGQGAISDREMAILERASSMLNQGLSEGQFRQVLEQLKTELTTGQPTSINQAQGRIRVQDMATGQTGTIDASEFDPQLYKKI